MASARPRRQASAGAGPGRRGSRAARASAAVSRETRAVLLARTPYGEADLVVQLFTLEHGRVSALARGARRSRRRFAGALEPMHELSVTLVERATAELFVLTEARLLRVHDELVQSLERMEAAGRALSWVRQAAPPRTPERGLYLSLLRLLARLDTPGEIVPARELAESGLGLLVELGWGVELGRCIACGKPCEKERSAMIDPKRGGLVCRSCGGARRLLGARARDRMARAVAGEEGALAPEDAAATLEIIEETLRTHAGVG